MWLRCRNKRSGHEASIPADLASTLSDWVAIEDKPSDSFQEPTYGEPAKNPAAPSTTPTTKPVAGESKE